jgi:hypothetical protein
MWWILHKRTPGTKPSSGPPNFVISACCPTIFKNAVEKFLTPEEIEKLDDPDSEYELIITNRVTKKSAGFGPKEEEKKEDLK